ncbi:MAG: hypothetical protein ACYC1K_00310 [Minisyncoccota bacterium]
MVVSFIYIIGVIVYAIGLQFSVYSLTKKLYKKVEATIEEIEKDNHLDPKEKKCLEDESVPFRLVKKKRKKLWPITTAVSLIELTIFSSLTVLLFCQDGLDVFQKVKIISITISGWLALKIFGNFQQWSGPVFGRANFYIFLIGSFANIGGAIVLGLLFGNLFI